MIEPRTETSTQTRPERVRRLAERLQAADLDLDSEEITEHTRRLRAARRRHYGPCPASPAVGPLPGRQRR